MSQSTAQNLRYLFDRPCQPIFRPKGSDGTVAFEVPPNYFPDRYKSIASQVTPKFSSGTVIPVREVTPPDISIPMQLDRKANFSLFNDFHKACASSLISTLMSAKSIDEFQSYCVYAHGRVNPYLFVYAAQVAILHRPDTKNVTIPAHVCSFPELYIDGTTLSTARYVGNVFQQGSRAPIEIPQNWTGADSDAEHRLAYFREDIAINMHHWHWHLVYPNTGPMDVVNKDRRGELFYYMHQQILARYNMERFSNNLPRALRIKSFNDLLTEGYFPKLDSVVASRIWAARQANAKLTDVYREAEQSFVTIDDMERWKTRLYEAIQRGSVYRGSDLVPLQEADGIDVLGNLIETSTLSINRNFYGNFHNQGHNIISYAHDPDNRYLEAFGVMAETATAMRDPVFYRWHTTINDIFVAYKESLTPYTVQQLSFDGVRVTGLDVVTDGSRGKVNNAFHTHWEKDQVDMSRGLDFVNAGAVYASFQHLQHEPFTYQIKVENTGAQRVGTVRIFMAPKKDERGFSFRFREQRTFFIELDRFTTTLRAGTNNIQRRSIDSSVTIPFSVSFRNLDEIPLTSADTSQNFIYCGCGWPDHMLIPKGTPGEGLGCDLFVMVTDYQQDRVENSSMDTNNASCDNAFSFCGVRNSRYPDRRPMGYPFDRLPRTGVVTLTQFLTPNMGVRNVSIQFDGNTVKDGATLRGNTTSTTTQNTQNTRPNAQTSRPSSGRVIT